MLNESVKQANVLTEEEIQKLFSYHLRNFESRDLEAIIASHRALNSRNAKLVHENDELMAEVERLKQLIFTLDAHIDFSFPPTQGELMEFKDVSGIAQVFKEVYRVVNPNQAAINEALEELK